jgi:hypothetical protein
MKHARDMNPREIERMCARVYLNEARRRRGQSFAATLLQWAKNARNRANAWRPAPPAQGDLFGGRQ